MKAKIFNKFISSGVIILILLAAGVKLYSILSFPDINDWNYKQLQRIDKTKNEFSFVIFGDNKNSVKTFENLIQKVNQENVQFAIDIGDLVYDGEKEKFRFFINQLKNLNKPLLTAIGNHELKEGGRANYYDLFGRFYYSFAIGNSYFIILDDANEKNLDPWQMEWLKSELKKSRTFKYRFVFMHVPLYDPRKGDYKMGHSLKDLNSAKGLNDLFDHYNVTMLFCSHIHAYFKGIWGKTPYVITGGAGAELAGADSNHYFYHYIRVTVSQQQIVYKVIKLKSPDYELIDRLIYDIWIYVYAFFLIHFFDLIIVLGLVYLGLYIYFIRFKMSGKHS